MANLNSLISSLSAKRIKIIKDVEAMTKMYDKLTYEVNSKFREELNYQKGSTRGLEDFFSLVMLLKKNTNNSKNAALLMKRMKDISGFRISEEDLKSKKEEKDIEEILG